MLNKIRFTFLLIFFQVVVNAQDSDSISLDSTYIKENIKYRAELDNSYSDITTSPLKDKDRKKFIGHSFFDVDVNYRVVATIEKTPTARAFKMRTTSNRIHEYVKYGILTFVINGVTLRLSAYQSVSHKKSKNYKNYLFLPFKDRTNSHETYGGGRYVDLEVPENGEESIVLDFNKAYNPYCHYNSEYSCPLVPRENHLLAEVRAGAMKYEGRLAGH
jgi:uncharacterized protein (DUF1684 family)